MRNRVLAIWQVPLTEWYVSVNVSPRDLLMGIRLYTHSADFHPLPCIRINISRIPF